MTLSDAPYIEQVPDRTVIRITGADAETFLQGMVTNDLARLSDGAVYTAFLSPQGKYLADFFVLRQDGGLLLDVAEPLAPGLVTTRLDEKPAATPANTAAMPTSGLLPTDL